jgi:hypothetical protein
MLFIVSPPRSGSSILAQLVETAGYTSETGSLGFQAHTKISPSQFNPTGYSEEIPFTLLNDQLIRLIYGHKYSLLHSPSIAAIKKAVETDLSEDAFRGFSYDLDELTVSVPADYQSRLYELSQHQWDVWGLTRMKPNTKWYKAYSKHGLCNGPDILSKLLSFHSYLASSSRPRRIYLKDPRLIFAFPAYLQTMLSTKCKILAITRNSGDLLQSLRSHYGHRMFTNETIDHFPYVSNHFNYAVQPQSFNDYVQSAMFSIQLVVDGSSESLHLSYDKLMHASDRESELKKLNDFLGAETDSSILRDPKL